MGSLQVSMKDLRNTKPLIDDFTFEYKHTAGVYVFRRMEAKRKTDGEINNL